MRDGIGAVKYEIKKAISGKDEIIEKVLTAVIAKGHILLEDIPGVGKTTLALAVSKAMDMDFKRVQFTPDVVPSDITGFTMYEKESGKFKYQSGAILTNFFLADEINRTSSKTQAALLEVMQEAKVTIDGETHILPEPFVVMATQNPLGTAGTQSLPEAQLDRFMIKLSMGYPDFDAQVDILKNRASENPLNEVECIMNKGELINAISDAKKVYVDEKIYKFITALVEATRGNELIKLGVSPRGALALCDMAKAKAYIEDRDYVTPEDVKSIFKDVCRHRIVLLSKAGLVNKSSDDILDEILEEIRAPKLD